MEARTGSGSEIIAPVNILVADDHALIREGLRMVLRNFDERVVCFDAFDGASVRRSLAEHPEIELVLLDRRLPDCDGMTLMPQLLEVHPALPIVMLSAEFDAETVARAIELGAAGFIPKTSVTTVLVSALKLIMAGEFKSDADKAEITAMPGWKQVEYVRGLQQALIEFHWILFEGNGHG